MPHSDGDQAEQTTPTSKRTLILPLTMKYISDNHPNLEGLPSFSNPMPYIPAARDPPMARTTMVLPRVERERSADVDIVELVGEVYRNFPKTALGLCLRLGGAKTNALEAIEIDMESFFHGQGVTLHIFSGNRELYDGVYGYLRTRTTHFEGFEQLEGGDEDDDEEEVVYESDSSLSSLNDVDESLSDMEEDGQPEEKEEGKDVPARWTRSRAAGERSLIGKARGCEWAKMAAA
ncbi:hypothetical protein BJ878DRAFT_563964 [Calycina marina]|uniref:Uncharacterized protein n=1 Tax=Calycina marina TaxID=1763456 RepID=A0A9P7ZAQ6_9HELO|nr:hypothetical protein BJ878DRAFT_563964 [Calycina marina]